MQVIFVKDLRKQGKKGDIKNVKDGYAWNCLTKNGYAIPGNEQNLTDLTHQKKREEKQQESQRQEALKVKERIEKENLEFKVKVGSDDRMFGSISQKQIKEELSKRGYIIDKKQIELDNPITSLGYHKVNINLYSSVSAIIKIHVVK